MMKLSYARAVLCLATPHRVLASVLNEPAPSPLSTLANIHSSSPASTTNGSNPNTAACATGFTYCGYILRDHKSYKEEDIIKAYCNAHRDNCVNGTARSDPLQALYICVPPNAKPMQAWVDSSGISIHGVAYDEKTGNDGSRISKLLVPRTHQTHRLYNDTTNAKLEHHIANLNPGALAQHPGGHPHLLQQHHPSKPTTSSSLSSTTVQAQEPQQPSHSTTSASPPTNSSDTNAGDNPPQSQSQTDSCISSLTHPDNKIELLCSCRRQCLNPGADHIARCDIPCSS